jgi:AraC family transcriptional regulator of adaptative response / DNA-3-methyladenine glycosylase II
MDELLPEFESCYRALAARDARFDGMFYTAVKTTGIYCRPVCPARTPRRSSCNFFSTAAAAERAGFRPCLRCRPELAPGRADFGATLAQSIYHRIVDGALDQVSLERLAEQVGVSTRHLRRLLVNHFGVTPVEIASTQRLLFAKKLLHETHLGMTEIAMASGFGSVRRFNAAFLEHYRLAPSKLRRLASTAQREEDAIKLRLDYRPPFDAKHWLRYLSARATAGVEAGDETFYRRTIRVVHGDATIKGWFMVRADDQRNALEITLPVILTPVLLPVVQRIRRLLDLDADCMRIGEHLAQSPLLAPLVEDARTLRVLGAWDPFELAVRTILGQQVSVRGASTLSGRLAAALCEKTVQPYPDMTRLPLRDTDLLAASLEELCALGLTGQRAQTLRNLAAFSVAGGLIFDPFTPLDQIVERLCSVSGIGPWTAQYVAMRGYGQADAFPGGDLGLCQAVARRSGDPTDLPSIRQLETMAEAWRPWRGYAASALWASLHSET